VGDRDSTRANLARTETRSVSVEKCLRFIADEKQSFEWTSQVEEDWLCK
jgi:hypothetical protein